MRITPEKEIVSDTILSNDICLKQQKYQCHGNMPSERSHSQQNYQRVGSNGNTPSDDENFDDEIQLSSYER